MDIKGNHIIALGYPEGKVICIALDTIRQEFKDTSRKETLGLLSKVLKAPLIT